MPVLNLVVAVLRDRLLLLSLLVERFVLTLINEDYYYYYYYYYYYVSRNVECCRIANLQHSHIVHIAQ